MTRSLEANGGSCNNAEKNGRTLGLREEGLRELIPTLIMN